MKILLVGNYLPDQQESMQRFAEVMKQELSDAGHEVQLLRPAVKLGQYPWPDKLQKWVGYADKFIIFPYVLRHAAAWADVIHICDHSNAMYVSDIAFKPNLITCHDLLAVRSALGEFPVNPVGFTGKLLQSWIARKLKLAKFIVCDSNATLNDCMRVLQINASCLSVVYLGLNFPYRPMSIDASNMYLDKFDISISQKYLINIGNNSWYKNRKTVLDIFDILVNDYKRDIFLIFVGRLLTPEMNELAIEMGLENRIKQLGSVSNDDLCALYSRAEGLIFPSFEEGFGWPVLEAQASGCPVFASNRAPMTEVGGEAAVYIDPISPGSSAELININLDNVDGMRKRGLINAEKFSNLIMRNAYLEIYSKMINVQ